MEPNAWAVHDAIARHAGRIAFQFSGGRDSTAALYLLRDFWPAMTVYHLDAGDQFPELRRVVRQVEQDVPIVRIETDARDTRQRFGLPSDIVPFDNTAVGRELSGRTIAIISKHECCARSLMDPLHERVLADGNTLLIRGVRRDEFAGNLSIRSGYSDGVLELLYPIEHWTADNVMSFIRDNGLPIAPFYALGMNQAPECMGCTAWWSEGRAAYMREAHPEAYAAYTANLHAIRGEITRQLHTLDQEVNHG
jgi:3'-phosphoadenosine 5'-phosphosulfate sulfotransferase (PAPS reductase)/FAD synthetase